MSERDLKRIEVLTEVVGGRRNVAAVATTLDVSKRQAYRLLARYQDFGGNGLICKARGCESNRSVNPGIRKYAVELVRTLYADFGSTLAAEARHEGHGIPVTRENVRKSTVEQGLCFSRKQR